MKNRFLLSGMALLAGIILIITGCKKDNGGIVLDFDITVPSTWFHYELNQENMVYYAVSPLENEDDTVTEDLLITKDALSGVNLNTFYNSFVADISDDTTFHVVSQSGDTTINGETGKKLVNLQTLYSINSSTHDTLVFHAKMTRYFFAHNNYGYILSMSALATTFNTYKPIYDDIISSFKFKK
jgi:hypothetical protein